jgi:hypothetical protein
MYNTSHKPVRARNNNGRIHQTHGNKLISTLENQYGIKTGLPPKLEVKVLLKRNNSVSITQLLKKNRRNKKRLK